MPCNTVSKANLALKGEIVKMDLLRSVVEKLGYKIVTYNSETLVWTTGLYNKKTGVITERTEKVANQIRQNYATELTKRTLGRYGWQVSVERER